MTITKWLDSNDKVIASPFATALTVLPGYFFSSLRALHLPMKTDSFLKLELSGIDQEKQALKDIMLTLMQDQGFRNAFKEEKPKIFVYMNDSEFWGNGASGKGANYLGRILMLVNRILHSRYALREDTLSALFNYTISPENIFKVLLSENNFKQIPYMNTVKEIGESLGLSSIESLAPQQELGSSSAGELRWLRDNQKRVSFSEVAQLFTVESIGAEEVSASAEVKKLKKSASR